MNAPSEKYVYPNCGNDTFQEAGSVATVTRVHLRAPDEPGGKPVFEDYSDVGSETIWDASKGYFIECRQCLTHIDADGFSNVLPDDEALGEIHALLTGKEWSSDELPLIAEILGRAGLTVEPPA